MRRAAVAIAVALVLSGCGGGEDTPESAASTAGVELRAAAGWVVSENGLIAAPTESGLTASPPTGPRVRAVISKSTARLDSDLDFATDGPDVVDGPDRIKLDRRDALRVTIRIVGNAERDEGVTVRRYLAAASPTGASILFILEAPAAQFDDNAAKLDRVPGWTS